MTNSADALLGMIEGMNQMADMMDTFKTSLEQRGWSAGSAEQAAIVVVGPTLGAAMAAGAARKAE